MDVYKLWLVVCKISHGVWLAGYGVYRTITFERSPGRMSTEDQGKHQD